MTRWSRLALLSTRLLAVAGVAAVLVAGLVAVRQLNHEDEALSLFPLGAAALCCLATIAAQSLGWSSLVAGVSPGHSLSPLAIHRSFVVGWLARYLPGPSLSPVGKYLACREGGVAPSRLAAAIVCEQLLQVMVLVVIPLCTAWTFIGFGWSAWLLLGTVAVVLPGVAATRRIRNPRLIHVLARFGLGPGSEAASISVRALARPFLFLLTASLASCAAFYVVAVAASPWPRDHVAEAIFIMGAAGLCGFIVPLTPSGAGVREAVIVALMSPEIGAGDALAVAVLVRAISVAVDAALALAAGAFYAGEHLRGVQRYPMFRVVRRLSKSRA